MDNKLTVISMLLLVGVIFVPKVMANEIGAICEYISQDDKNRLRRALKASQNKIRNMYPDVKCAGKDLLQFAIEEKANKIGFFMVKKISVPQLKSQDILGWAKTQGQGDSEIGKAIADRIK